MARILVIDDDEVQRRLIRHVLVKQSHHVTDAEDGTEGIRLQKKHGFDLVVTDIIMPGMDGIETVRELICLYPTLRIIAISAHRRVYLDAAKKFGATETLAKPFTPEDLVSCVENCLHSGHIQNESAGYGNTDGMAEFLRQPAFQD